MPGPDTLADRLEEWFEYPDLPIILAIARPVAKRNLAAHARADADDPALQAQANLVILAGQHAYASADEQVSLAELQAIADRPGMRGRIALPPRHDADDVAALYARAARGGVFVNPALHEPFGLTLVAGGRLGDAYGRGRMMLIGLAGFTAASAAMIGNRQST